MKPILSLISLIFLTAFLNGCIEHTFNLRVIEDHFNLSYEARGDRMDLDDGRELFPDTVIWKSSWRKEQQDDETVHILESSLPPQPLTRLNQMLNWGKSSADSVHLTRTAVLKRRATLFGSNWSFNGVFHSRQFDTSYGSIWEFVPEECRALEDDQEKEKLMPNEIELLENKFALGIMQWNKARFDRRFDKILTAIQASHPEVGAIDADSIEMAKGEWESYLHRFLNELEIVDPTVVDLNWWDEIRVEFAALMSKAVGEKFRSDILNIGDALENEYQITKDLEDDRFNFKIDLPGSVTKTDGTEENEWIVWTFYGRDLLNADKSMSAVSFQPSIWKIGIAAFVVIVLLNFLRRGLVRRKKVEMKFH